MPAPRTNVITIVAALLAVWATVPPARGADAPWWDDAWQYRLIVRVPPTDLRGGINTARVDLAEQSALCAKDGADLRVLDETGRAIPHKVDPGEGESLTVKFLVPDGPELFYLYYGNPQAPPTRHGWEERLGGLTLETRSITPHIVRASQIPPLLSQRLKSYGKKPWREINDLSNPFGADDHYLSIYDGAIYCPEDGRYTFALNADDVASFRLRRGSVAMLYLQRDGGVPSEQWRDPKHARGGVRRANLRRGVYRVAYYHVENTGAQLAKLGWQRPSSDAIVTVPARAFVDYLPVDIEGRQARGAAQNPFFVAEHKYNLLVNSEDMVFPFYHFESRCGEGPVSFRWDFGDGHTATGAAAEHEFGDMQPQRVTLTVRDAAGQEAAITRTIFPPRQPIERMTLRMQLQFEGDRPVLAAGRPARLRLFLKNVSSVARTLELETVTELENASGGNGPAGTELIENLRPTADGEHGWLEVRRLVRMPEENMHLAFRLLIHGRPAVERRLSALSTAGPLGTLEQDREHNLRDAEGRLVVLRLADVSLGDVPPRRVLSPGSRRVRMVLLDESLGGPSRPGSGGYYEVLAEALNESYGGLTFDVRRPRLETGEEYPPIRRFLEIRRHVLDSEANLVIFVCQPESVVNTVPLDAFESYLVAAVDQVLSRTRAQVVLVTPPPLPGRPDLARPYARVVKRTGLRKGLAVADLYSRFMLTADWEDMFKAAGSGRPSYLLAPNPEGQRLIGREIFSAIVRGMDKPLAAASRQAKE